MKKLITLCLVFILAFSLAGCQKSNDKLTIDGLKENFNPDTHESFLIIIENESNYDNVTTLSQMLCFDEWLKVSKNQGETLRITIVFNIHTFYGYMIKCYVKAF